MMGNYEQLKAAVAAIIRDNGQEEITGDILQGVLLGIINSVGSGATFAGVATPSTNPGTPDPNVFYIAGQAGTYTNFNLTITDGLWVFENKNGTWVGTSLDVSVLFATGEDVSLTNIASSIAGAGSGYLPTFGVVQEMLNGVVGTVNRSALDTATTAGLYRVMASSAVVGYLFVTVSQSTRYRVQFLSSDITAFTDGGTESDYKGHILTRSYNDSDSTAAVCPLHTWSAWQEYGGDAENVKYGNESVADALDDRFTKAEVNTMLNELFAELAARDSALQAMMDYYVCDTAAGTAAKTITASGYVLTRGGCIRIKMTNTNTANNVTLNINSTGAKALYYDGVQASSANAWEAGEVLEVYYDGTQYQCASGGGGKTVDASNVIIGDGTLADYFKSEGSFDSSFLTNTQKYAQGAVGSQIAIQSFSTLNYGRIAINKGAVISLKTKGYGTGVAYLVTDSTGVILEKASSVEVDLVDYRINSDDAAFIYINCITSYFTDFHFEYYSLSPDLANDYNGGTKRIASAEIVKILKDTISVEEAYTTELCFAKMDIAKDYSATQGDVLLFEFEGNTGTRTRLDYFNGSTPVQLFSLGGNVESYQMEMPASFTRIRNFGDTSVYVKITNLTKKESSTTEDGVRKIVGRKKITQTLHFDGTQTTGGQAMYGMAYPLTNKSVLKIYNITFISSGATQIELHNGYRQETDTMVQISAGRTYYLQPNNNCEFIGCFTFGKFTCDIDVTQYIYEWDKPVRMQGLKIATLGDSITAWDHCAIGYLTSVFLHAHLINNFALGQAYAADWSTTVPYFDTRPNSDTPDNVLSNQVRRLLRWTTPLDATITWTHPWEGEFSIDPSIGTGQGHTDDIPDIIYIAIGTNDQVSKIDADISAVISSNYSNLTRQTMGSAYRWAVETLQSAYPQAMIFLASPLYSGYSAGIQIAKGNIVKAICEETGAIYIPSREESGYTMLATKNGGTLHPAGNWPWRIGQFVAKKIREAYIDTYHDNI